MSLPPLRILIAEDSTSDRSILRRMLIRLGHEVIEAADGVAAVAAFQETTPDIVLLDALMPRMDGMEAARRMRALAGERLVPLIFLTSLTDAADLARCLDAGGDDFLTKPYNRVIIDAKLNAFRRMQRMHDTLSEQRDLIHARNQQLVDEQAVAKQVFDNVAHSGCLDAPNIHYHASPQSIFNGDVLFATPRPDGGLVVFLGDFTGHGLPAAIGAMPVAEIFYGMAGKGFGGAEILREMNQKLCRILPTGRFCCGAMIEVDFKAGQVRAWNGGLPDGWVLGGGRTPLPIRSRFLPLGILPADRFDGEMEALRVRPGDQVLLMTDGVLDCVDDAGNVFGEAGVREALADKGGPPFERLLAAASGFSADAASSDDLTLFALDVTDDAGWTRGLADTVGLSALTGPLDWRCEYELQGQSLADFNPLPLLLHLCLEVPGLRPSSGEIYTLLSEMYNNALEHGILGLPSHWKRNPDGFGHYYAERQRRLQSVGNHRVRFALQHEGTAQGGRLRIACEDSGEGFDVAAVLGSLSDDGRVSEPAYAGRGLLLLKRLTTDLSFHQNGNRVEIVYDWKHT